MVLALEVIKLFPGMKIFDGKQIFILHMLPYKIKYVAL